MGSQEMWKTQTEHNHKQSPAYRKRNDLYMSLSEGHLNETIVVSFFEALDSDSSYTCTYMYTKGLAILGVYCLIDNHCACAVLIGVAINYNK